MDKKHVTLNIERMSYSADAIAHLDDGRVCFCEGAVPQDVAEVEITRDTKKFCRGKVTKIIEPSPQRVIPQANPVIVACGCPWAYIDYPSQLIYKRQNVCDALQRIGHMDPERVDELVEPCFDLGNPWGYRNKIELDFQRSAAGRALLGMHEPQSSKILKVDTCELLDKRFQKLPKSVSGALSYLSNSHGLDFERIGIRASTRTNNVEISLWTSPGPFPRAQVAKVLQDATKTTSIVRVLSKGPLKARKVVGVERLAGHGNWTELVAGNEMSFSAPSFFQVNTKGAEKLIELVLEALDPQEDDIAMDLYSGAGTFTIPLAQKVSFVEAVESYGPAVRDLRRNLQNAHLDNAEPTGGDAAREFPDFDADIIVVDPPRAGLAPEVVDLLSKQKARAIAYVSCDPSTLARDLKLFEEKGVFIPEKITPVDLFPQTYHVECVTKLIRK